MEASRSRGFNGWGALHNAAGGGAIIIAGLLACGIGLQKQLFSWSVRGVARGIKWLLCDSVVVAGQGVRKVMNISIWSSIVVAL